MKRFTAHCTVKLSDGSSYITSVDIHDLNPMMARQTARDAARMEHMRQGKSGRIVAVLVDGIFNKNGEEAVT